MATVKDVNEAFMEKGIRMELPFPEHWLVKNVEILEKKTTADKVGVLLALKMVDDQGREVSDVYYGESTVKRERKTRDIKIEVPTKEDFLPLRPKIEFDGEQEALEYIREAFLHLLKDKGYEIWGETLTGELAPAIQTLLESGKLDAYAEKGGKGFLIMMALRSAEDDASLKGDALVQMRKEYGNLYDYGLVIPAFQQSLGVRWRDQEYWLTTSNEHLSIHRVGLFAVDNLDPNRIYPLTIYTKERELFKYMVNASRQWSVVKGRYVQQRITRTGETESKADG